MMLSNAELKTFHISAPRQLRQGKEELLLQYIERFAKKKLSEMDSEMILILVREASEYRRTISVEQSD